MAFLWICLQLFITVYTWSSIHACTDENGWMIPFRDTYIEVYSTVDIYCGANDIRNVTDLSLTINSDTVSPLLIEIYNETTINLHVERADIAPEDFYRIQCLRKDTGNNGSSICLKYLYIGYQPQNVTNFQCTSYNWQNLTCTWDIQENPIKTNYIIGYGLPNVSASKAMMKMCSNDPTESTSCTWSDRNYVLDTSPFLKFTMNATNILATEGRIQELPIVNQYAIVLPDKMENLNTSLTANSALLSWKLPDRFMYVPRGFSLNYSITYKELATWSDQSIQTVDTTMINGKDFNVSFRMELPHANVPYEISVRARSSQANASEEKWWSEAAILKVTSLPDIPCSAPEAALGSFQVDDLRTDGNRLVTLLWSPIGPECKNGDQFQYVIEVLDSQGRFLYNKTTDGTELTEVLQAEQEYTFNITSLNSEGISPNSTTIYLSKHSERPVVPESITKIQHNQNLVEINWKPNLPQNNNISSYTIFYCRKTSNHCKDKLYWMTVPNSQTSVNLTLVEVQDFDFAVASNQNNLTSGLIWSQCSINMTTGDTSPVFSIDIIAVNHNDITFQWQLPCIEEHGFIIGYNITYCSVTESTLKPEERHCLGASNSTIIGKNVNRLTISNLTPSTSYKIEINVRTAVNTTSSSKQLILKTKQENTVLSTNEIVTITCVTIVIIVVIGLVIAGGTKYRQFYNKIKKKKPHLPWEEETRTVSKQSTETISSISTRDGSNTYRNSTSTIFTTQSRTPELSALSNDISTDLVQVEDYSDEVFAICPPLPLNIKDSHTTEKHPTDQFLENMKFAFNPRQESFHNFGNEKNFSNGKLSDQHPHHMVNGSNKAVIFQEDSLESKFKYFDVLPKCLNSTALIEQPIDSALKNQAYEKLKKEENELTLSNKEVEVNDIEMFNLLNASKQNYVQLGELPAGKSKKEIEANDTEMFNLLNASKQSYVQLGELPAGKNKKEIEANDTEMFNLLNASKQSYVKLGELPAGKSKKEIEVNDTEMFNLLNASKQGYVQLGELPAGKCKKEIEVNGTEMFNLLNASKQGYVKLGELPAGRSNDEMIPTEVREDSFPVVNEQAYVKLGINGIVPSNDSSSAQPEAVHNINSYIILAEVHSNIPEIPEGAHNKIITTETHSSSRSNYVPLTDYKMDVSYVKETLEPATNIPSLKPSNYGYVTLGSISENQNEEQ